MVAILRRPCDRGRVWTRFEIGFNLPEPWLNVARRRVDPPGAAKPIPLHDLNPGTLLIKERSARGDLGIQRRRRRILLDGLNERLKVVSLRRHRAEGSLKAVFIVPPATERTQL